MPDDVEVFIHRRRLEVRGDRFELRIGGPRRASRQALAPQPELALAQGVGRVDEVQLVADVHALQDSTEPCALRAWTCPPPSFRRETSAPPECSCGSWRARLRCRGDGEDEHRDDDDSRVYPG